MLNIVSLFIGTVTLVIALFAFIPLFGWANWFIIPFAIVGLAIGVLSRFTSGRTLNLIVIGVAAFRLVLGHGIP